MMKIFKEKILAMFESRSEYGDAFKGRRTIYFTDRINSKSERIKNLENNLLSGIRPRNEGIEAELIDIIVYAFFALDRLEQLGEIPVSKQEIVKWALEYFGAKELVEEYYGAIR
jgi:hypothetical protein